MGEFGKISVDIDRDLTFDAEAAVARGEYESLEQIIEEALADWMVNRPENAARIRKAWEEGLASGEPVEGFPDIEAIIREGRERLRKAA